jgi:uncharacterized repeat protein (TIGR03803 family)
MQIDRFRLFVSGAVAAFVVAATLSSGASASGNSKVIYNFTGGTDGGDPATALVFDSSGNAYGTSVVGGNSGCGTIFKLKPLSGGNWQHSTLYSFSCGFDGKNPYGGVTFDANGNLFGTTVAGGSGNICAGDGCGVAYELTKNGLRVLYDFQGGSDGFGPGGAVIFDTAGNLYGTTPDGGVNSAGTVYELSKRGNQWHERVIHAFTGLADGGVGSLGALHIDAYGDLFGVTEIGGAHSAGTIYEMMPDAGGTWDFRTLYAFRGQPDAGSPYGGLIQDGKGNLFGTTYYGGANGAGSVFELHSLPKRHWSEHVLYSFKGSSDGGLPTSTLLFDSNFDLWGTTSAGGASACNCGTVFKVHRPTGQEIVLHRFGASQDGQSPYYGLTPGSNGKLYGSTAAGGLYLQGTIFELTP